MIVRPHFPVDFFFAPFFRRLCPLSRGVLRCCDFPLVHDGVPAPVPVTITDSDDCILTRQLSTFGMNLPSGLENSPTAFFSAVPLCPHTHTQRHRCVSLTCAPSHCRLAVRWRRARLSTWAACSGPGRGPPDSARSVDIHSVILSYCHACLTIIDRCQSGLCACAVLCAEF